MAGLGALTKDIKTDTLRADDPLSFPVAASTTIYGGSLVATNASGDAVPASADITLTVWGVAAQKVVNTGAAGQANVEVKRGVYYVANGTAGDAITKANAGQFCYALDDQTVSISTGGGTRPIAGVIVGVRADGKIAVANVVI